MEIELWSGRVWALRNRGADILSVFFYCGSEVAVFGDY